MSATGQGQAGGEGGGEGEAQAGPDFGALSEQVGGLSSSMEEMRGLLQGLTPQQQQAEAEPEQGPEIDLSFLDDPAVDPAVQQQMVQEQFERLADQRAQALVAPVMEQQTQMRREQQARDLAGEFPEMADPKVAQMVAGPGGLAEQAATALGNPNLAAEPGFWRLAYMAHKAAETANQEGEGSGDPGAAHLESGNGAGPGMTQEDRVKQIMESGGRGSRVLDGI
jgi:hypothetical protein